jgi:hypothetical protein
MVRKIHARTFELCESSGVEIRAGYWRPELAWQEGENRSPSYDRQREKLVSAVGDQKELWEELLRFGVLEARMAERYFCLNDEVFVPFLGLIALFALPECTHESRLSARVNAVLYYLDSDFEAIEEVQQIARGIRQRVGRLRVRIEAAQEDAEEIRRIMQSTKRPFPKNLPLDSMDTYEKLARCEAEGLLEGARKNVAPGRRKAYEAVTRRYGLADGEFHTYAEVATKMNSSRQAVQYLVFSIFDELGIEHGRKA